MTNEQKQLITVLSCKGRSRVKCLACDVREICEKDETKAEIIYAIQESIRVLVAELEQTKRERDDIAKQNQHNLNCYIALNEEINKKSVCEWHNNCPSRSGWCVTIKPSEKCIPFLQSAVIRLTSERDAAVFLLEGHCFSCVKAEITEPVPGHPLMTCDHIRTMAIASSGRSRCPYWQMKPLICSETQNPSKSTSLAPDNFIGEQPVEYGCPFDEPIGGKEL